MSGPRTISKVARKRKVDELEEPTPGFEARNELDTRADTICAGTNFLCIRPTGMMCSVKGFHQLFAPIDEIPVATVATTWDDPETGQTFILIMHQALYFGKQLDHSLINPNQIRVFLYVMIRLIAIERWVSIQKQHISLSVQMVTQYILYQEYQHKRS
jgi:hypothetical protein